LLQELRWKTCACGLTHAKNACPTCGINHGQAQLPAKTSTRGALRVEVVVRAIGEIVAATVWQDRLIAADLHAGEVTLHEAGANQPMRGEGNLRNIRFHRGKPVILNRAEAVLADGSKQIVDGFRGEPQFTGEGSAAYWLSNGHLWRLTDRAPEQIAAVLRGQTQIWAGEEMGMAYYRAGNLSGGFLFFAGQRATVACDDLGLGNAEVLNMRVVFAAKQAAWIVLTLKEQARILQRLILCGPDGHVRNRVDFDDVEEGFAGACAGPTALFLPTNEGVVRIGADDLKSSRFDETADFVSAGDRLLLFRHGIYVVATKTITELRLA
jgi:hypothetical protein